jgi:hypothetical protein
MANRSDGLPVLTIDGRTFSDFDGFAREFTGLLRNYTWRGNLDAFNDLLRGGFGTPDNGWVLKWVNAELSWSALGYDATILRLQELLQRCDPSNRSTIQARIRQAERHKGLTLFDEIVDIIREHGPGCGESEDGVLLELA